METSILAEVTRGSVVESVHYGAVAVVDGSGELVAKVGEPNLLTFVRSSAKPFQAVPLLTSGAADRFGFSDDEIAIACGSHDGEPLHTHTVEQMLQKIDLPASALLCGAHEPYNKAIAEELKQSGVAPSVLQNNCSGKHAGMLAVCRHLQFPITNYLNPQHPLQELIQKEVGRFAGFTETAMKAGIDGCGVPTYALPVKRMALMFARLVATPEDFPDDVKFATRRIFRSISAHPALIAGDGEFDTEIMKAFRGRIISKIGAEGIWCAGILPDARWPGGLGIALKILDGSTRARSVIALEILRQLEVFEDHELERVPLRNGEKLRNHQGTPVGEIRVSDFRLTVSSTVARLI